MLLKLEQEVSKLTGLKDTLKEMGASLWQGRLRKKISGIWWKQIRGQTLRAFVSKVFQTI